MFFIAFCALSECERRGMDIIMKSMKRLFKIFDSKTKIKYFFLFFGELIGAFFDMAGIALLLPFIQLIMSDDAILENAILNYFFQVFTIPEHLKKIYYFGSFLIVLFLVKMAYMFVLSKCRIELVNNEMVVLGSRILKEYINEPYTQQADQNSSFVLRLLSLDINRVMDAVNVIFQILNLVLAGALLGIYMLLITPLTTILLVGLLGTLSILYIKEVSGRLKTYNKELVRLQEKVIQTINQTVGSSKEIKILKCETFFFNKYSCTEKQYTNRAKKSQILTMIPKLCLESVCMIILILIIFFYMMAGKTLDNIVVEMTAIALVAIKFLPIITQVNTSINTYITYIPSIDAVFNLFNHYQQDSLQIPSNTQEGLDNEESVDLEKSIKFENVDYKYPHSDRQVLRGINLEIQSKKSVGLVGETGAGKTTFVDILLGILKPISGTVKCGEADIYENAEAWAENVGYIPQTIYLLDESIRNNVAFGVSEDEINEERVWEALKQAQMDEFVKGLPQKLDTEVGERGARLSGGQRQRIGIARALYRNPEILVLDEATSALDNETEKAVMDAIESTRGKVTLIIIAHRLTTIHNCDFIYEIKDGRLLERNDLKC